MQHNELEKAVVAAERDLILRGKMRDFVKGAWPLVEPAVAFRPGWHIDLVCEHLEAVRLGQISRLIINIPPGCMKSLLVSVFFNAWEWLFDPGLRFMYASFDGGLTARDAKKVLSIVQSDWYQARFPSVKVLGTKPAVTEFSLTTGGSRFSTSVAGKALGRHCNRQVFDDPIKPESLSDVTLDEAETWWGRTMTNRQLPGCVRIGIMQRLHERDLAGKCIEQGYTLLRLPMRYEATVPCVTLAGKDPRVEEGEILWPQHKNAAEVDKLEVEMTEQDIAAQMQQRPAPEGGAIFKHEWFQSRSLASLPVRFDELVQSWDCTFKDANTSDFVVGQVWGLSEGDFYLLDEWRKRANISETEDAMRAMRRKWPQAIAVLVEDKANGSAIITRLDKEIPGMVAVEPRGGKEARANAVSPLYRAKRIFHVDPSEVAPEGHSTYEAGESFRWVDKHRAELTMFPMGRNDDRVDCMSQAVTYLYEKANSLIAAMRKVQEDGPAALYTLLGGLER